MQFIWSMAIYLFSEDCEDIIYSEKKKQLKDIEHFSISLHLRNYFTTKVCCIMIVSIRNLRQFKRKITGYYSATPKVTNSQ